LVYDKSSKGAVAYIELAAEIINKNPQLAGASIQNG
jgi:hypothetical protein